MDTRTTLCVVHNAYELRINEVREIAAEVMDILECCKHAISVFILPDGRVDLVLAGSVTQEMLSRDYPSRFVGTYDGTANVNRIKDDLRCLG